MNMFARFDENPAMTLQDIKETKHYGRTDARTDTPTDAPADNVKTVYPPQTKFAGGYKESKQARVILLMYNVSVHVGLHSYKVSSKYLE